MKKKEDWVEKVEQNKKTDENNLKSREVAHILDCSPDDVLDYRRKGLLKAKRQQGRLWIFTLSEVKKSVKRIDKYKRECGRSRF